MRQTTAEELKAARFCPDGKPHAWSYDREARTYNCPVCLAAFSKTGLKELTDRPPVKVKVGAVEVLLTGI